ncbi:MAG: O-antigen ligase family protein [Phycisphaerales bacterium]|nr:O-antigen ligase family protein [Phycisphaerales bacterium]
MFDPAWAEAAFEEQARLVPAGIHRHAWVAGLAMLLLMTFISAAEVGAALLGAFFLLRTRRTIRLWPSSLLQPVPLLIIAWTVWQFTTLLWSGDVRLGLDEISEARWGVLIILLWPVIRYRHTLIFVLVCSFLITNAAQWVHWLFNGADWLPWVREPDRISAWWGPAVGGTMLTGALGLHLPAAMMGRGRTRVIGIVLSIVTLIAILMTGTRGAWIASAGLTVIVACVAIWTSRQCGRLLAGLGVAALVLLAAGLYLREPIMSRVHNARDEITRALEEKDYTTSTGTRIIMYWWAIEAFAEHPIGGVGAGGYHAWIDQHLVEQDIDPARRRVLDHAHCALLHVAATSGTVGLLIAGAFIVHALRGAFAYVGREQLGTYLAGPGFALVGLLLISVFDSVHVNTQSAALMAALLALAPGWLPREARP